MCLNAPTTERYVQAKGRLQCWNSKSWRPEGLVEAAERELEGFKSGKGFKRLKPGKRQAWCLNKRGLCAGKCSKGWRPEGFVEAARELEGFKRIKGFKGTTEGYVQANTATF